MNISCSTAADGRAINNKVARSVEDRCASTVDIRIHNLAVTINNDATYVIVGGIISGGITITVTQKDVEVPEIKYTKVPDASYIRVFTFAVLEEKASGKQFVFISTHFDHEGGQADQASSMIAYIAQFRDMPMFMCGDYNGSGIETIMINHGYVSSKNVAAEKVNDVATMSGGSEIDFVFTNGRDVGITYYTVVEEETDSDHFPVLVKFKFEK